MPKLHLPLKNVSTYVMGPLVTKVLKDLNKNSSLINPTQIIFLADGGVNRPSHAVGNDDDLDLTGGSGTIVVEVDQDYLNDSALATAVDYPEHPALFNDSRTSFLIKPVYALTEIRLNVTATYKSRIEALQWLKTLRMRTASWGSTFIHDIDYSYPVPDEAVALLSSIYRLTENQAGYGLSLREYIDLHRKATWVSLVDQNNNNRITAIAERQNGLIGYFDNPPEKPEHDKDAATWSSTFSYMLHFQMPIGVVTHFPLTVHSQSIPLQFVDTELPEYEDKTLQMSMLSKSIHAMRVTLKDVNNSKLGAAIPFFDDWVMPKPQPNTLPLLRVLTLIEESNPRLLFNLQATGLWELPPMLVKFMEYDESLLLQPYGSLIRITVYKDDHPMSPDELVIVNGDLMSKQPLDLRHHYHVVISLNYHLTTLSLPAKQLCIKYGELTKDLLKRLWKDVPDVALYDDGTYPEDLFNRNAFDAYRYVESLGRLPTWQLRSVSLNLIEV